MFSRRLPAIIEPNQIAALLHEMQRRSETVLDLTESNPTLAGFSSLDGEIQKALSDPRNLRYQPAARGLLRTRQTIADYYAERGLSVSPEDMLLTASSSEAFSYLFKLLL